MCVRIRWSSEFSFNWNKRHSEHTLICRKELTDAECIRKLPKGKHSVKGIGMTEPDPTTHIASKDGYTIPMGSETKADLTQCGNKTSLLYNEYIVYDVAQVKLQYLVKFKFNYKSLW